MNAATVAAIEADERRAARDSHRAAGGSKRRPLKSFMTAREKREARDAHAARIRLAVEEVQTPEGFERWLEALGRNEHLSPMNAALVALQTPGEVAASVTGWKRLGYRVRAGERLAGRLTAPGFWPLAYFTAAQAGAEALDDLPVPLPPPEGAAALREALAAFLAAGERPRLALEAVAKRAAAERDAWEARELEAAPEVLELPF
jgi:hypothetical protein